MTWTSGSDDPEVAVAASALGRVIRERQLERYRTWTETAAHFPTRWRKAATDSEYVLYVTADELEELNDELEALLLPRFRERIRDKSKRPPGSVPVEMLVLSYPIAMPSEGK